MRLLPEPFETLRREAGLRDAALVGAVLGAFLVPGLLGVAETVAFWRMAGRDFPVWRAAVLQLPQWLAYSLLTPLILWLGGRLPLRRGRWAGAAFAHATVALALGSVYAAVAAWGSATWSPFPTERGYREIFLGWYLGGLPLMTLVYAAVLGSGWALQGFALHRRGEVRAARLQAQLADARLSALRMQLHPHFLFNSLNGVAVLVRDRDWEGAERAVHLLAGLLRDALRTGGPDRTPLSREMDFIGRYLELEAIRFPDRLRVSWAVDDRARDVLVPALILQPLVENALRHGIAPHASAGRLELAARLEGDRLILTVADDGGGPPETGAGRTGVGLANVAERLAMLYGDAGSVALAPGKPGGAVATVTLPLERAHA